MIDYKFYSPGRRLAKRPNRYALEIDYRVFRRWLLHNSVPITSIDIKNRYQRHPGHVETRVVHNSVDPIFFFAGIFFLLCRVNFFFNWTRPLTANGAVSFSCRARPFDEKLMSSQSIEQQGTLFLRAKSMEETRFSGHVHNDPLLGWGRDPPPPPGLFLR